MSQETHFLANRRWDTVTWEAAIEAAREARDASGAGLMDSAGNARTLSDARSRTSAIVGIGANINWDQLSTDAAAAAAGAEEATAPTEEATAGAEEGTADTAVVIDLLDPPLASGLSS